MEQYGLRPDSGLDEVANIIKAGVVLPSIDKSSLFLPVDPEASGIVMGWDIEDNTPFGTYYYLRMRNHAAVHYLLKNGQSIDADPLLSKDISDDRKDIIKAKVTPMLDEVQADGKRISEYCYNDFIGYVKREINYFGETASPVIALTLGSHFFGKTDEELEKLGIPLGNYKTLHTKSGLMMDAFDCIAREFPSKLAIEKHLDFITGLNRDANSITVDSSKINKPSNTKKRLQSVVQAITKMSGVSPSLKG